MSKTYLYDFSNVFVEMIVELEKTDWALGGESTRNPNESDWLPPFMMLKMTNTKTSTNTMMLKMTNTKTVTNTKMVMLTMKMTTTMMAKNPNESEWFPPPTKWFPAFMFFFSWITDSVVD